MVDVFNTTLDNNGLGETTTYHGIWADNNSDIALGERDFSGSSGGYNTLKNNHGAGVYRSDDSYVLIGYYVKAGTEQAGYNSIYDNGTAAGTYSGKDVYNDNVATTYAHKIYWGSFGGPSASQFAGPVDYSYHLTSPPGPGGAVAWRENSDPNALSTQTFAAATGTNGNTISTMTSLNLKLRLIAQYKATSRPNRIRRNTKFPRCRTGNRFAIFDKN